VERRQPLKRKTPLKAKRASKRRVAQPCSILRCKRRAAVLDLCKTHAQREADRLFSLRVRAVGYCQLAIWAPHVRCGGALPCCPIVSPRYHPIRFGLGNALAGCAAHHKHFTERPIEWRQAVVAAGIDIGNLEYCALNDPVPALEDVLRSLRMSSKRERPPAAGASLS